MHKAKKTFRVYYEDGNQKLFEAPSKDDVRQYCMDKFERDGGVLRIEEVKDDESKRV